MKTPQDILAQWLNAVNNKDLPSLLGLYDNKAVLVPTFSNELLNTTDKIRKYFETLGTYEELTVTLNEKSLIVQELENQVFSLSGFYNWSFIVDGKLLNFEARFTYLITPSKPNPIIHHHSSETPKQN